MSYADHKVKVTVTESHCPKYKEGDVICFEGAMLDKEKSDGVCMVAMKALTETGLKNPGEPFARNNMLPSYDSF